MKKINRKKSIIVLCILVPIAAICAFIPKLAKEHKKRKYTAQSV